MPTRPQTGRWLARAIEALILLLVVLSPWAFGAVEPVFEAILLYGLALLTLLWAARILLQGRFVWKKCPVILCVAGLFVLGIWQLQPLPRSVLDLLSPNAGQLYSELLPATPEGLPSGEDHVRPPLAAGTSLSLYPEATRRMLLQLLAVILLYAVVRNNVASPGSLRRLSFILVLNGSALAFFAIFQFFTCPRDTVYWAYKTKGAVFGPFVSRTHYPFYLNICIGAGLGLLLSLQPGEQHRRRHARRRRHDFAASERAAPGLLQDAPRLWLSSALALMVASVALSLSRGGFLALVGGGVVCLLVWRWLARVAPMEDSGVEESPAPAEVPLAPEPAALAASLPASDGAPAASLPGESAALAGTRRRRPRPRPGAHQGLPVAEVPPGSGWSALLSNRFTAGLLALAAALALVVWLGGDRVEARLATLWSGQAFEQSRLPLWADSWPLVLEYPLLGTGLGTFAYVEPLHRSRTWSLWIHEHAHNEYLEALIEGGIVRLALSLLAIGLVFRYGLRAVRRHAGEPLGGLALGALFGFTTLVLHSIGDFGVHLPAIAFLATVLCAQLVAAGRDSPLPTEDADPPDAYVFRWHWAAPLIAALLLLALARLLWVEGRRLERVQVYRILAARLQGDADPEARARQVALLTAASQLSPNSATLLSELGRVHLERFEERQNQLSQGRRATEVARLVLAGVPQLGPLPQGWAVPQARLNTAAWNAATASELQALSREHLVPGLQAYLQARDACPLLAKPHVRLAANVLYLKKADSRTVYLDRAKRVVTNDAELWFLFGAQELLDGQRARAAQSWHRSLELGDQFLPAVLQLGKDTLGPQLLVNEVLPERADLLLTAAIQLYPRPDQANERRPFLEKALAALTAQSGPLKAQEVYTQARIHAALDQPAEASTAYQKALELEPYQQTWRLEAALLLRAQGRLPEARQELLTLLRQQSNHPQAREQLRQVERELRDPKPR